jgi:hypothetical protein
MRVRCTYLARQLAQFEVNGWRQRRTKAHPLSDLGGPGHWVDGGIFGRAAWGREEAQMKPRKDGGPLNGASGPWGDLSDGEGRARHSQVY